MSVLSMSVLRVKRTMVRPLMQQYWVCRVACFSIEDVEAIDVDGVICRLSHGAYSSGLRRPAWDSEALGLSEHHRANRRPARSVRSSEFGGFIAQFLNL